jgi:hypothetical protein
MASPNLIAYSVFKQRHHVAVDETSTCAKRTTKTVTMILPLFLIQFQETCRRKTAFFGSAIAASTLCPISPPG